MEIIKEKGDYSWGETVEKKVYKNGPQAKPLGNQAVKMHFERNKL